MHPKPMLPVVHTHIRQIYRSVGSDGINPSVNYSSFTFLPIGEHSLGASVESIIPQY